MAIDYIIDENDYLTHQLYVASVSIRIKKKRQRSKVGVTLFYFACGFLLIILDDYSLGITFIVLGLLWFFLYPIWERRRYIKHYKEFIEENYKQRIGRITTLEINNELIISKDNSSESKIQTIELDEIIEIPTMILIKIKGGQSVILPKHKISNLLDLTNRLKELATHLNIKYMINDKWQWK